ncbi:hypothetical protein EV356DRAFT_493417 [Viridothelium virens]|uniref:HTH APSES-type domain-containing protein n=1 Tax=Viridothelium virens TaxID=1048519 RepID=A0A6A6GVQ2_VIRVR|nr:hypothetical protein EV356DRAFT_493417 [Viridothelium virens]
MVARRTLPSKRNPLLTPEHSPQLEILVERRRLGSTNLDVKPGQVGVANATRKENLGVFDYAHLRVPLPADLKGTGIFQLQANRKFPEAYFLMRRSSDGYLSATGMFKAAFPWASLEEEAAERKYITSLKTTADDEVAGNVWIPPDQALELGTEYSMTLWIQALLDPEPVHQSPSDNISSPPIFRMAKNTRTNVNGTAGSPKSPKSDVPESTSTRPRTRRSVSPTKIATPSRKIASPRKPRVPKGSQRGASTRETSNALQDAIAESPPALDGADDKVKVGVETSVAIAENGEEVTNTKVKVEMPKGNSDLPLPENTEEMVRTAKEMVEEARKLDSNDSGKVSGKGAGRKGKRKAEEITGAEEEGQESSSARPEKKAKITVREHEQLKARSKALIGLTATFTIAAAIPYFFG